MIGSKGIIADVGLFAVGVESFDSGQGAGAIRLEMIVGDVGIYGIGFEVICNPTTIFAVIGETTFDYIGIFVGIRGEVRCCTTSALSVTGEELLTNVGIVGVMFEFSLTAGAFGGVLEKAESPGWEARDGVSSAVQMRAAAEQNAGRVEESLKGSDAARVENLAALEIERGVSLETKNAGAAFSVNGFNDDFSGAGEVTASAATESEIEMSMRSIVNQSIVLYWSLLIDHGDE
ncbi:hypothetical protein M5K25_027776 [Dendrobium thyrsiflorum]|uniref:Uncharacterized protein n=1 Tax=Dendrobium thyrsiflorum TaxID=117978 RepID=A0ABD0TUN9_DENTH